MTWGGGGEMLAAYRLATQADTVWDPCCREDVVTKLSGICEMSLGSVCGGQKVPPQSPPCPGSHVGFHFPPCNRWG